MNYSKERPFIKVDVTGDVEKKFDQVTQQLADTAKYTTDPSPYLGSGGKNKKVLVSFIADDAPKNDLTRLLPIVKEKNIPLGLAVITDFVGKTVEGVEYMTWEEIKQAEREGCEVLGHTHLHRNSTTLTDAELEQDLALNKAILTQQGFFADGLVFPFNATNYNVEKTVRKYYKYSFAKNGAGGQKQGQNYPLFDNQRIGRIALGSYYDTVEAGFPSDTSSLEYYKARVDWAIANDNWLVFVLHTRTENFLADQQQHLRDVIDYIRAQGVEIVSPRKGFEIYGNPVQIGSHVESGHFIIDASKEIYNEKSRILVEGLDKRTSTDPITNFKSQHITYTPISNTGASSGGFPVSRGGILTTYHLSGSDYNRYQTYDVLTGTKVRYIRYWVSGSWGAWEDTPPGASYYGIGFTGATPISDFPLGKITYTRFTNTTASSSGMPLSRGGLLITYRLTSDYYVNKQEYVVSGSLTTDSREIVYVRYLDSSNNWTAWERKSVIEYAKTHSIGDIPAQSTIDITFNDVTGITELDNPTIRAINLPTGLVVSLLNVTANTVTFRVANITTQAIAHGSVYYKIVATKK